MRSGSNSPQPLAGRALEIVRSGEYSKRELATRALGHLFEAVRTDVLCRELSALPHHPRTPPGFCVRQVNGDRWQDVVPRRRWRTVSPFLRRGDVGYVATVDDEFAGWVWVSRRSHRDPWSGLVIRLAEDEAYAYSLGVPPEFRALGVARPLMVAMLEGVSADPGVTRVYGWVDRRNRKSQLLLRLLGFVDVQTVWRLHLLHHVGAQVPHTATPPYGPLSRAGRHSTVASLGPADRAVPTTGRIS